MNLKTALIVLVIFMLLTSLAIDNHIAKANSSKFPSTPGGLTVYSPLNQTYYSNYLTLNLQCGCPLGVKTSVKYSIDSTYEGAVPLIFNSSAELHMFALATGTMQLPELSKGSHRLTIYQEAALLNIHGANTPAPPYKQTAPGSADYVASWTVSVDFFINSSAVTKEPTPPTITNLSIENKTYNENSIPLNFTVNEYIFHATYSLDGKGNITIGGNTTLTGLSGGAHNLTIYVLNNAGNMGASETISFNVAKPVPFPFVPLAVSVIAVAVLMVAGLLVYHKKYKRDLIKKLSTSSDKKVCQKTFEGTLKECLSCLCLSA